jgi:superfamily II DNA or RNA helicase
MDTPLGEMKFRYTWRSYQARVLEELSDFLRDDHLHIVAAPGSGKTVLGLEVVHRLDQPTLILAPTLTIRDQWIDRLIHLFLPEGAGRPDWLTTDIRQPGLVTVATYQALHMAHTGRAAKVDEQAEDADIETEPRAVTKVDMPKVLNDAGVRTLIVDEAHHLRSEWWKSLIDVKKKLRRPTVVALTATPPLDVQPQEWDRYQDLCGPIDAEVSVPELVLAGDLCPHQDYVHLSTPCAEEGARIRQFRDGVSRFVAGLPQDTTFVDMLHQHPWVQDFKHRADDILAEPALYSSMLIFLNHAGVEVPRRAVRLLGHSRDELPALDLEWLERLLTELLYGDDDHFAAHEEVVESIRSRLKSIGAIERRKVMLRHTTEISRLLASSLSKLDSIAQIVQLEHEALGDDLRQVILTDYIRKEYLPRSADDVRPLNKIGVATIFERLRRDGLAGGRLGILCGTLVVVPGDAVERLREIAEAMGIEGGHVRTRAVQGDERYRQIEIRGEDRQRIVRLITRLFSEGQVNVLVGTQALLGEGWDAPSLNSLILASFVGSYMLSNQMRGRAIRTQGGNPDKTANIWHLICVETEQPDGGPDFRMLARRCRAFVGVSFSEPVIENGIRRLGLGEGPYRRKGVEQINDRMRSEALSRAALKDRWHGALQIVEDKGGLVQELRAASMILPRRFALASAIRSLIWRAMMFGALAAGLWLVWGGLRAAFGESSLGVGVFWSALAVAGVFALPKALKAVWLIIRHGPVASSMAQIGKAVQRSLTEAGAIQTDISKTRVRTRMGQDEKRHEVYCHLTGGTTYEQSLFVEALSELLRPIDNPRYLLIRRSGVFGRDYHAVPAMVGKKKEHAAQFLWNWKKFVGPAELVYTRSAEGREMLLKARAKSMSAAQRGQAEQMNCWR